MVGHCPVANKPWLVSDVSREYCGTLSLLIMYHHGIVHCPMNSPKKKNTHQSTHQLHLLQKVLRECSSSVKSLRLMVGSLPCGQQVIILRQLSVSKFCLQQATFRQYHALVYIWLSHVNFYCWFRWLPPLVVVDSSFSHWRNSHWRNSFLRQS